MANEKEPKVETVVVKDGIDDLMFEEVRHASKLDVLCTDVDAEGLAQDAFTSFFTHEPHLEEKGDALKKSVLSMLHGLPEFADMRAGSKNDEITSAIGSVHFTPTLIEEYRKVKEKQEEQKKKQQEQGGEGGGAGQQGEGGVGDVLSPEELSSMRQRLRKGLEKAQEKSDEFGDAATAWGTNSGELHAMPPEERFALAEKMTKSTKMKRIADFAGRFKNVVNGASAVVASHGVDEIVDIGMSNDVGRMLPSELVKLVEQPELFYIDFLESKLLTYNLKNPEPLGKGPIIVCMDISSSMQGDREAWAKGVALSLQTFAEKQSRAFGFIAFENTVRYRKFFPKDYKPTLNEKVEIAEIMSNGGTDFEAPLRAAFDMRKSDPSLKTSDIIFITDGECSITHQYIEEIAKNKRDTDTRIFGVMVNDGGYGAAGSSLQVFCDQISVVNNLGEIDTLKDILVQASSNQHAKGSGL